MKVEIQSGSMDDSIYWILATVLIIVFTILLAAIVISDKNGDLKPHQKGSTKKVDDSPPTCDICFDDLDGRIATCECGKTFHDSCARPTGSCPYCSTHYSRFTTAESRFRCPNCGRFPLTAYCKCGAILSVDGHFICRCGKMIDPDDSICDGCGTHYLVSNDKEPGVR